MNPSSCFSSLKNFVWRLFDLIFQVIIYNYEFCRIFHLVDNFVEKNINGVPLEGLGAEHAGKLRLCLYYDSRNTNFKANENVFSRIFFGLF